MIFVFSKVADQLMDAALFKINSILETEIFQRFFIDQKSIFIGTKSRFFIDQTVRVNYVLLLNYNKATGIKSLRLKYWEINQATRKLICKQLAKRV